MPNDANQDKLQQARVGVIGGSGLYAIEGLTDVTEVEVKTPFGTPSDAFRIGLPGLMWCFWRVTAGTITCSPAKFLTAPISWQCAPLGCAG